VGAAAGSDNSPAGQIRLRYWASARAAAGVREDALEVSGPATLAQLCARAKELHAGSGRFSSVLDTCSVLVDDRPVASERAEDVQVVAGETVEFLPPFAGG
jgi:sulfur-carrier protein